MKVSPRYVLLSLCCLVVFFSSLSGQDWHPFPNGHALLYRFLVPGETDTFLLAVKMDSVRVEGADKAHYLYRMDRPVNSHESYVDCWGNVHVGFGYWINVDHYLGKKMLFQPDGICVFVTSAGDSFSLITRAAVGASWEFIPGVWAQVDSIQAAMFWGAMDSVKYISLSSGQSIALSKRHGLVRMCNLLPFSLSRAHPVPIDLHLTGILDRGLGRSLPGFEDVFRFKRTDAIGYLEYQRFHSGHAQSRLLYSDFQLLGTQGLSYAVRVERWEEQSSEYDPTIYDHYPPTDGYSLGFDPLDYPHLNLLPYQHSKKIPYNYPLRISNGVRVPAGKADHAEVHFVEAQDFHGGHYDACAKVFVTASNSNLVYAAGMGNIWNETATLMYPIQHSLYCYYHSKVDHFGDCIQQSAEEVPVFSPELTLFPNPAGSAVTIAVPEDPESMYRWLTIWDAAGREVFRRLVYDWEVKVEADVQAFADAMYTVCLEGKAGKRITRRLVVQH